MCHGQIRTVCSHKITTIYLMIKLINYCPYTVPTGRISYACEVVNAMFVILDFSPDLD